MSQSVPTIQEKATLEIARMPGRVARWTLRHVHIFLVMSTHMFLCTDRHKCTHTLGHTDLSSVCACMCPLMRQYVILASQSFLGVPGSANTVNSEPLQTQLSSVQGGESAGLWLERTVG